MCRHNSISARLLDIAHLLGCLRMLTLHDVTLDDVRMMSMPAREKVSPENAKSKICTIKSRF